MSDHPGKQLIQVFTPAETASLTAYAADAVGLARTWARQIAALDTGGLLTGFRAIDIEQIVLSAPTGVTAAGVQGGGATIAAGSHNESLVWLTGGPIIANPRTDPFAVAFRAAFQTPEAAGEYRLGFVGLGVPAAGKNVVALGENYTHGGSQTNMCLLSNLGVTTWGVTTSAPVDHNVLHDWLIFSNGVTMTAYRDGVAILTLTDLSGITTSPCHFVARGNLGHAPIVTDACLAFART